MNIHKNARLTPLRREEMALSVVACRQPKPFASRLWRLAEGHAPGAHHQILLVAAIDWTLWIAPIGNTQSPPTPSAASEPR